MPTNLYLRVRALVQCVESDPSAVDMLTPGERLAVALVLERQAWLQGMTALSAVDRISAGSRSPHVYGEGTDANDLPRSVQSVKIADMASERMDNLEAFHARHHPRG